MLNQSQSEPTFLLRRALNQAQQNRVDALLLELQDIEADIARCQIIQKELIEFPGPVFVYISGEVKGAANLLMLCGDRVYFDNNGSLSSAVPKMFNDEKATIEQLRELRKMTSESFAEVAKIRGYDIELSQVLADGRREFEKAGLTHNGESGVFGINANQASLDNNGMPLLSSGSFSSFDEFFKIEFGEAQLLVHEDTSSYELAKNLMPYLPALWILLMVALFAEMNTPGFGVGGTIGSVGLVFCLFLQYQLGTAGILDISLIFIGLALLAVEIVVLPGFGIAGILGLPIFGAGVVMSFIDLTYLPENEVIRGSYLFDSSMYAMFNLSLIILGTFFGTLLMMYYLPKLNLAKSVVLVDGQESDPLDDLAEISPELVQGQVSASVLLHSEGKALTDLRPVGSALVCNVHLDVITHGEMIDKGANLCVVEIEGNRVVVEKVNANG